MCRLGLGLGKGVTPHTCVGVRPSISNRILTGTHFRVTGSYTFQAGSCSLPPAPVPADRLALFLDALISLRDEGVLSHPQLNPLPATPPPTRSERRRQARHDRNIAMASTVVGTVDSSEERGFSIVYTDGSSTKVKGTSWVGGLVFHFCWFRYHTKCVPAIRLLPD